MIRVTRSLPFRGVALLIAALLLLTPTLTLAQETEEVGDCQAGRTEAKEDAKGSIGWAFAGFFCGVFGILGSVLIEPKCPPDEVVGKSQEYATCYCAEYEKVAKKKNLQNAAYGCLLGVAASLLIQSLAEAS